MISPSKTVPRCLFQNDAGSLIAQIKTKIGDNSNQIKTKSKDSFELRASGYEQVHGARGSGLEARGF